MRSSYRIEKRNRVHLTRSSKAIFIGAFLAAVCLLATYLFLQVARPSNRAATAAIRPRGVALEPMSPTGLSRSPAEVAEALETAKKSLERNDLQSAELLVAGILAVHPDNVGALKLALELQARDGGGRAASALTRTTEIAGAGQVRLSRKTTGPRSRLTVQAGSASDPDQRSVAAHANERTVHTLSGSSHPVTLAAPTEKPSVATRKVLHGTASVDRSVMPASPISPQILSRVESVNDGNVTLKTAFPSDLSAPVDATEIDRTRYGNGMR